MSLFNKRKRRKKHAKSASNQAVLETIDLSLAVNIEKIHQKTGNSPDIVIRKLKIGLVFEVRVAIVYVKGIVDTVAIQDYLLESMMQNEKLKHQETLVNLLEILEDEAVAFGSIQKLVDWNQLVQSLLSGETIILIDGLEIGLSVGTQGGEKRSVQEPSTQMTIRGPKEGFTESLETNMALVRRIIQSPNLWVESFTIGKITQTDVAIMYLKGIAKDEIIGEIKKRLNRINVDSILESGYIEQHIEDQTLTPFPMLENTERPDKVAGNLLEGRIAIFVNGTPFVLLAPVVFIQFFQASDDYYIRPDIATAIRLLRILTFFLSIIAPATYIAATTFHQEMIPTKLLLAIAAQREVVPFPAFVEALIMEVAFEILREAGTRMPKAIGSAISIVGALVIGQAAVQAGIVSPAMVIVVALTAIANFATPSFGMAISTRLIRFLFMLAAASFGFYGMILGILVMIVHLCGLCSFGVPYMAPLAPFIPADNKDIFPIWPSWGLHKRPQLIGGDDKVRQGENQMPKPPSNRGMVNRNAEKGDGNES